MLREEGEVQFCPGQELERLCSGALVPFDIGRPPTYVSIVSCSLSCMASVLIVLAYLCLREIRKGAQKIITLLAIADFFTAFGYLVAAANFLSHYGRSDPRACSLFQTVCEIQSLVTSWSSLSSFAWTSFLALHFFLIVVRNAHGLARRLLPWQNIFAWLAPLLVLLPLLALGRLGYSPYAASNWCYIKDSNYNETLQESAVTISLVFVAGKFWEILSYFVVIILFGVTRYKFGKLQGHLGAGYHSLEGRPEIEEVNRRLLLIPLLFLGLRVWGTSQFFFSLAVSNQNQNGCIPHRIQKTFIAFGILQGIGDGGQGWGNAILYIFSSAVMREKMFVEPLRRVAGVSAAGLKALARGLETIAHMRDGSGEEEEGMEREAEGEGGEEEQGGGQVAIQDQQGRGRRVLDTRNVSEATITEGAEPTEGAQPTEGAEPEPMSGSYSRSQAVSEQGEN